MKRRNRSGTPETARRPSILVADDAKNVRLTVVEALEPMHATVLTAVSGEDALQRMEEEDVDVLLLDLALPGVDGIEVLREVGRRSGRVSVVVISGHGTVSRAVEVMKLGAVDFLEKPFSPEELRQAVRRALGRPREPVVGPDSNEGDTGGSPAEA